METAEETTCTLEKMSTLTYPEAHARSHKVTLWFHINKSIALISAPSYSMETLRHETEKLHAKYSMSAAHIKKLESDLEKEQAQIHLLRNDNQSLRQKAVQMSALSEQEEEYISNKLLKHITGLKKEKSELLVQVEQEEEYLTNMLQKKLAQMQKDKIDLENALEQEQEYMVNRLQKQLDILSQQQQLMSPSSSRHSVDYHSLPVSPAITGIGSSPSLHAKKWSGGDIIQPVSSLVDLLKAEVNHLKGRAIEMEREYIQKQQQCIKYKNELIRYRKENNLPLDDITAADDGRLPRVFRSLPPPSSPNERHHYQQQTRRSTSNSSTRSITIPPLNLSQSSSTTTLDPIASPHSCVLPQAIPTTSNSTSTSYFTGRSSVSSSTSSSFQRKTEIASRRVSSLFGLSSPPQHPPPLLRFKKCLKNLGNITPQKLIKTRFNSRVNSFVFSSLVNWKNFYKKKNPHFLMTHVLEAVHRSAKEQEILNSGDTIDVEHLERILPQLLLDF
ncbi:hypothetical protein INT47_001824 [Mucor saturninus]|uniref:Uncharacterized protein n=1 Tax=Mucor saturninus TaxID=64648 RepID=A0A8H7QHP4_9FUNG|nr:hypothetical protein INT47_001824 [Mucor saturninus]